MPFSPLTSPTELLIAQLAGLQSWQRAPCIPPASTAVCGTAKEIRLDAQRRLDARRRQEETMQARAAASLAVAANGAVPDGRLRAIVVHPHDYQRHNLVRAFETERRCAVIAQAADGAAGVGLAVIEQPDLVLLAQQMAYMTGFEAIPEIRRHAPRATVAMQVAGSEYIGPALAAGAHAAFISSTPFPRLVAEVVGVASGAGARSVLASAGR